MDAVIELDFLDDFADVLTKHVNEHTIIDFSTEVNNFSMLDVCYTSAFVYNEYEKNHHVKFMNQEQVLLIILVLLSNQTENTDTTKKLYNELFLNLETYFKISSQLLSSISYELQ